MKSWVTSGGQTIYRILSGRCNGFLVSHGNRYLLVDPGSKIQWKSLIGGLEGLGVNEKTLAAVLLTHSHFDHAANAADLKERLNTPLIIHASEAGYLQKGDNPTLKGTTFVTKLMTDLFLKERILQSLRYRPVEPDILIDERYDLNGLGFNGYLIHTPGHSPGSLSVVVDDEIALVGDTMFGVFKGSVFPPYAADPGQMIRSWEKLLATGCSTYLPAHGWERNRQLLQRQYDQYKRVYNL